MPSAAKVVSSGARQRSSDGATIAMAGRVGAAADELEDLVAHELQRPAGTGPFEEAHRALQ